MVDNMKEFLSVKNLYVEYTSDGQIIRAVNGVSFDLKQGHTLGLVGETGAGKTSIAKSILRILPDPPAKISGGEIYFNDTELLSITEAEMRKLRGHEVAMIFQDPMTALNPVKRVGDQIAEGILVHNKITKADARQKAVDMLKKVGISEERAFEYPHQFSGGMKQRVVIAMALACNPKLLLADEPTTTLDVTIQAQVLEMIKSLKDEYKTSMLMITHDLGVVAETCDEVAVIYAGEIIEIGCKEAIFDHPSHPYTQGLFGALPDLSKNVSRLNPIKGIPADPTNLPSGCRFHPRCPYAKVECSQNSVDFVEQPENGHLARCINVKR
jgi:peptide/nickel transport system ATP-binding protein